jgi:aerobic carbon-monoxide dehydrogenase large subunit
VAFAVFDAHNIPEGVEPNLDAEAAFDPENWSIPHGSHLCAVDVDTETGRTSIRRYVAVDDVGTVINPLIVEGQVHGGIAQGVAQALYEGAFHDEAGTLTTATFADYLLPSAADLPSWTTDRTQSPSTTNPLGVKGVGETGTIAATPAVINAIVDALSPWGVDDIEMPATPQRVWRAIQEGESARSSRDLPTGTPDVELEGGGRLAYGEIGLEAAEEHITGDVPEQGDETGGVR